MIPATVTPIVELAAIVIPTLGHLVMGIHILEQLGTVTLILEILSTVIRILETQDMVILILEIPVMVIPILEQVVMVTVAILITAILELSWAVVDTATLMDIRTPELEQERELGPASLETRLEVREELESLLVPHPAV